MFTGLIEAVGEVTQRQPQGTGARVVVTVCWPDGAPTGIGDSIAVNGCCLTVVAIAPQDNGERLTFELSHETLRCTALGDALVGAPVNCERAARLGDRLGGHLVTGHIDGVGTVCAIDDRAGAWDVTYSVPDDLAPELVVKGSVAIDGVSLTVNALPEGQLQVTLIPHTVAHTQLLHGGIGKRIHLETDLVAKHVRRLVELGLGAAKGRA